MAETVWIEITMSRGAVHRFQAGPNPTVTSTEIRTGEFGEWIDVEGGQIIRVSDIVEMSL